MKFENKKWVLRVALAGALSLGVASVAKADARLDGMGADVRQVDDVDAIWLYPNEILQYKNTVDFRLSPTGIGSGLTTGAPLAATLGTGNNEWGGVIHDLGDDFGTIATYVNRPNNLLTASSLLVKSTNAAATAGQPIFAGSGKVGGATNAFAPTSNVDVFWGKDIFGLHLNYGDDQNIGGAGKVAAQQWGLSLGVNLGSAVLMSSSQFHVDYAFDSLTDNTKATPLNDNGVYTIKLGWLGQSALNDKDNVRLFADAQYDNNSLPTASTTSGGAWASQTANDAEILVGGSIKHNITDKGFVNTGLNLEYDGGNSTTNTAYSSWSAIWNGSVESSLSSWLTARAGLSKAIFNRSYNQAGAPTAYDASLLGTALNNNVAFNTGLSATAENWTLDAQLSVSQLDAGITTPAAGSGIFFANAGGELLVVSEADLRYKF